MNNRSIIKKIFKLCFITPLVLLCFVWGIKSYSFAENPDNEELDEYEIILEETDENNCSSFAEFVEEKFDDVVSVSLEDYVNHEVDNIQTPICYSSSFNSINLSDDEKLIYDRAKIMVAEVAKGERSSTKLSIPIEEFGWDGYYSASDLGLSSVVSDGKISDLACDVLENKLGIDAIDYKKVYKAIKLDNPYETYWMGLTISHGGYSIGAKWINGEYKLYIKGELSFNIAVSDDYKYAGESFMVDISKTQAVQTAIKNINIILDAADSKNDLAKIKYYRDWICENNEYNYATIENDDSNYGDPWQIIYAFDGNKNTKIVCEGYSKAFMTLCNKTQFSDSSINCYLISGYMNGGNHMWNIMHWSDNRNYLIDLTNCNGEDYLFMDTPASGNVSNGYTMRNRYGQSILYSYNEDTLKLYSESDLRLGTCSNTGLQRIFVNYDAYIMCFNRTPFTVIRQGGSDNCLFRLDSVKDSSGAEVLNPGSYDYSVNNVFTLSFNELGKYTLSFSAKDVDNVVKNSVIEVEVKENLFNQASEEQVRAFVTRFYTIILERSEINESEIDYYVSRLLSKEIDGCSVAKGFILSPEYVNKHENNLDFVKKMYAAFFDREADAAQYYCDILASGKSREVVLAGFVNSPEFKQLCADYGINPGEMTVDPNSQGNNGNNQGSNENNNPSDDVTKLNLDTTNVDPDKLDAYVKNLYIQILGREYDEGGLQYWKEQIMAGTTYDAATAARVGFFESNEYIGKNKTNEQFVIDCYHAFLGREPEPEGLAYWTEKLDSREYSKQKVIDLGFGHSEEFKKILEDCGFVIMEDNWIFD